MPYFYFDPVYAPCAFLMVKTDGDPYKEEDTILVQRIDDAPAIAENAGWTGRDIEAYEENGHDSQEIVEKALEWMNQNQSQDFPGLDIYFAPDDTAHLLDGPY